MSKKTFTGRYWVARAVRALIARLDMLFSILIRHWLLISSPGLHFLGGGQRIAWNSRLRPSDNGSLYIGPAVTVSHGVEITVQGGEVSVGASTFIGPWVSIVAKHTISIGRDVLIAERVTIRDQDHSIHGASGVPIACAGFAMSPISIGDDVWIGAGAVLLRGVKVARGAVIAANAVVTGDVGELEIVGGVPARRLGFRRLVSDC